MKRNIIHVLPMDDLHDESIVNTDEVSDENEKLFYDEVVKEDYDLLIVDNLLKEVFDS